MMLASFPDFSLKLRFNRLFGLPQIMDVREAANVNAISLLGDVCLKQRKRNDARALYQRALKGGGFSAEANRLLEVKLAALPK
jgi:predicted negative regulator of RcsB-dependent stress response